MSPNVSYFIDILLAFMCLFNIVYILYGRTKHQSLIGNYGVGKPDYDVFRKLISNKSLIISSILAIVFILNAVFDARRVLQSSYPDSVLIVAPIFIIVIFSVIVFISSRLFPRR